MVFKKTVKKLYPNLDNLNDVITQAEQKENDTNHIQEFTRDVKSLSIENKIIILVDDSVVRGNTLKILLSQIKECNPKEIKVDLIMILTFLQLSY